MATTIERFSFLLFTVSLFLFAIPFLWNCLDRLSARSTRGLPRNLWKTVRKSFWSATNFSGDPWRNMQCIASKCFSDSASCASAMRSYPYSVPISTILRTWDFSPSNWTTVRLTCSSCLTASLTSLREILSCWRSPVHAHISHISPTFWYTSDTSPFNKRAWSSMLLIPSAVVRQYLYTFPSILKTCLLTDLAISTHMIRTKWGILMSIARTFWYLLKER